MLIPLPRPVSSENSRLYETLISHRSEPVYVFGRNKYAARVASSIPALGYIDDFTDEKSWMGKPVVRTTQVPTESVVVSCVVDGRPITALNRVREAKIRHVIDYFTLHRLDPVRFGPVDFCENDGEEIQRNAEEYQWVYDRLADGVSRNQYQKVINFRSSLDLDEMRGFTLQIDRQYFEPFLILRQGDTFVDGGGFDGSTSCAYARRNPNYRKIYYFEPNPAAMHTSKEKLYDVGRVDFRQKGLFRENAVLRFSGNKGSASHLSATGETEIEVVHLDGEIEESISLLKLDVEGAEYDALEGAARHIESESPAMAVCVYHSQQDFWRIPKRVMEINPNYEIYVRHYSEGIMETVMFFIPGKGL